MKFDCPKCGRTDSIEDINVPDSGTYTICPACKERFLIKKTPELPPPLPTTPDAAAAEPASVPSPEIPPYPNHNKRNIGIVAGLVCLLLVAVSGLGYYYFSEKIAALSGSAPAPSAKLPDIPATKPPATITDPGTLKNMSTAQQKPGQEKPQAEAPPPAQPQNQPQADTQKKPKKQVRRSEYQRRPLDDDMRYEQDMETEYQRKQEFYARQEAHIRKQRDREERRLYQRHQSYENCRNQWCNGDAPGVSPATAARYCSNCEKLLR